MRTISNQDLIDANRKALAEHRLMAQQFVPSSYDSCVYTDQNGCGCAIGVALTDPELKAITSQLCNVGVSVRRLQGLFSHLFTFEDINFATNLQYAHDRWIVAGEDKTYRGLIGVSPT